MGIIRKGKPEEEVEQTDAPTVMTSEKAAAASFRMAEPRGYYHVQVDAFVDEVVNALKAHEDALFAKDQELYSVLTELDQTRYENSSLKAQIEVFRVNGSPMVDETGAYITESQLASSGGGKTSEMQYLEDEILRMAEDNARLTAENAELRRTIEYGGNVYTPPAAASQPAYNYEPEPAQSPREEQNWDYQPGTPENATESNWETYDDTPQEQNWDASENPQHSNGWVETQTWEEAQNWDQETSDATWNAPDTWNQNDYASQTPDYLQVEDVDYTEMQTVINGLTDEDLGIDPSRYNQEPPLPPISAPPVPVHAEPAPIPEAPPAPPVSGVAFPPSASSKPEPGPLSSPALPPAPPPSTSAPKPKAQFPAAKPSHRPGPLGRVPINDAEPEPERAQAPDPIIHSGVFGITEVTWEEHTPEADVIDLTAGSDEWLKVSRRRG